MKFLILLIVLAIPYSIATDGYDDFFFHTSIICNQSTGYFPINIYFIEKDSWTYDVVSGKFDETIKGYEMFNKIYTGRDDGDGPLNNYYELTAVITHNCRDDRKIVRSQFVILPQCKVGKTCHLYFHIDLTEVDEGVFYRGPFKIVQE